MPNAPVRREDEELALCVEVAPGHVRLRRHVLRKVGCVQGRSRAQRVGFSDGAEKRGREWGSLGKHAPA